MCHKDRIFSHEALDIGMIKKMDYFKYVLNSIEELQLTDILCFNHELVYQFYATLYVSRDKLDIHTWVMEWMTEDRKVTCTTESFLDYFNFPHFKENDLELHMHVAPDIIDEQLHRSMDPAKVGGAAQREPKANDLEFNNKTIYYIHCKSLCPTIGANSNRLIRGVLHNTLHGLSYDAL